MAEHRRGPLFFAMITGFSYLSFAKGSQSSFKLYDAFTFGTLNPTLSNPDSAPTVSFTMMISICLCIIVAFRNVSPLFKRSCEDGKSPIVLLSYFTVNRSEKCSIPRVGQQNISVNQCDGWLQAFYQFVLFIQHILNFHRFWLFVSTGTSEISTKWQRAHHPESTWSITFFCFWIHYIDWEAMISHSDLSHHSS